MARDSNDLIVGLDIGTSKIVAIVAQMLGDGRYEIVGLGQSRKTESYWTRTTLTDTGTGVAAAQVLLHSGVFKASFPDYPADRLAG